MPILVLAAFYVRSVEQRRCGFPRSFSVDGTQPLPDALKARDDAGKWLPATGVK